MSDQPPTEWNRYPETKPSEDAQVEVAFYANPFEWFTGIFTPKGCHGEPEDVFQWHNHQGDDEYHTVENVKAWMYLPDPLPTTPTPSHDGN